MAEPVVERDALRPESRIELLERIGAGGYATVHRARDRHDPDRFYAVKVLNQRLVTAADVRRFERECAALRRLADVDGVLRLHHGWVDEDGWGHLATDLCHSNYADRVRALGVLTPDEVLDVGLSVATALAAAHAVDVIHGDVKPANLLIDDQDRVLLADFGSATLSDTTVDSVPPISLRYSAPEVLESGTRGTAADLYGLGATLHHLVTGAPAAHAGVHELDGVPSGLARVIRSLLASKPRDRPAGADEVVARLTRLKVDGMERPGRDRWRSWTLIALASAVVVLAVAAAVAVRSLGGDRPDGEPAIDSAPSVSASSGFEQTDSSVPAPTTAQPAPPAPVEELPVIEVESCSIFCDSFDDDQLADWVNGGESTDLTVAVTTDGLAGGGLSIEPVGGSVEGSRYIKQAIGPLPAEGVSVRVRVRVTEAGGFGYWLNLVELSDGFGQAWTVTLGSEDADRHAFVARRSELTSDANHTAVTGSYPAGRWQCVVVDITPDSPEAMALTVDGAVVASVPGPLGATIDRPHSIILGSSWFSGELPTLLLDDLAVGLVGSLSC